MRRSETVKPTRPAFGFAPRPGRTFVANLAARAGRRAGERRDRRRVIVGLDLAEDVRGLAWPRYTPSASGKNRSAVAPSIDGGVVLVRRQHAGRADVGRALDPLEQRALLLLAADEPLGVEDLVPAVLAVRLREHHQLDIRRIAAELAVARDEVLDLVVGEREAEALARFAQRRRRRRRRAARTRAAAASPPGATTFARSLLAHDHALGHAIRQHRADSSRHRSHRRRASTRCRARCA